MEVYKVRVKGTWYFDTAIKAKSVDEALDTARDLATEAVFNNTNNIPFELSFNDFDSWIE